MIDRKDIEVKKTNLGDVELKTRYENKIFRMYYSHVDMQNSTEIDSAVAHFVNHILKYWEILNLTLENNKVTISEDKAIENYFISRIFAQGGENDNERRFLDIYYLARKELDINYTITDDTISVFTDSTCFINIIPYKEINRKELLNKRLAIIRTAKANKISISYKNKTKDIIFNNRDKYKDDIRLSRKLYKELKSRWEYIRDIRGLHVGTRDDKYLEDTVEIMWEFEALRYRDKPIGIINSVTSRIDELYESMVVQGNRNYAKIYL